MRYFASPTHEAVEAEILPSRFHKNYQPYGRVTVGASAVLHHPGVEMVVLEGETLAIQPDTAAWAFLSPAEWSLFQDLDGKPFAWLESNWPTEGTATAGDFVTQLYRRGLVTINGQAALDRTIFTDSPNIEEGNLVELLVTEKCNLGCVYCLAGTNPKMPAMTPEIARRAIDLAFRMDQAGSIAFEFSGGEPFLKYKMMQELVTYIQTHPDRRGRPVYLHVQTNGTLLDEERVRWLKENEIRVGVSLDGTRESQNLSRPLVNGKESFSKLLAGIDLLQRQGVAFGALVVLNRYNVDSVDELADFLLDNGIFSFKLNPVAYLGTARNAWDDIGLRQEEVIRFFIELMELIAGRGYPLLEDNLRTMCEFLVSKQRRTRCLRSHCGAGDTFQAVSASGDIYPCGRATQTPALKMGNVQDSGLIRLSDPAQAHEIIAQIRSRRPDSLDGCTTCPYRQLCQAGCSAQAFERYGTVRHRTPECAFYKTLYPHLMRWLSFNQLAFEVFRQNGYFDRGAILFHHEYTGIPMEEGVAVG